MKKQSFTTEIIESTETEQQMGLHRTEFSLCEDSAPDNGEFLYHMAEEWWQVAYGD